MVKFASSGLITHLDLPTTSLCTLWKIVRTDGVIFSFTDHDQALSVDIDGDGVLIYKVSNSFNRSAISTSERLVVDEVEVVGILDSDNIKNSDLIAGRFDNADIKIAIINWQALGDGVLKMRRGWLGEVELKDYGFTTELLGLILAYETKIVEILAPRCVAELADTRCGVNIEPADWQQDTPYTAKVAKDARIGSVVQATTFNNRRFVLTTAQGNSGYIEPTWNTTIGGTTNDDDLVWTTENAFVKFGDVSIVQSRKEFTITGITEAPDDYMEFGVLTMLSGDNSGLSREILSWHEESTGDHVVTLFQPFPFDIDPSPGDLIKAIVGCIKTVDRCKEFDNIFNFRGFPFVPGQDNTLAVV